MKLSFLGIGYKENKSWKMIYSISKGNGQNALLNFNDFIDLIYEINGVNEYLENIL